jgi:Fe-S cluster biogenesis protein NfuA
LSLSSLQEVFAMTLNDEVVTALPAIRAGAAAHGVHLRLVGTNDEGIVELQLRGKSVACPMSQRMFAKGILQKLKREIPLVMDVVSIDAP